MSISPEAKQAAEEMVPKAHSREYQHKNAERIQQAIDAATAKLREELEQWKELVSASLDKAKQIAHQQPSRVKEQGSHAVSAEEKKVGFCDVCICDISECKCK